MPDKPLPLIWFGSIDCDADDDGDEVIEVLAVLRYYAANVFHPVLKACLEEAAADIAHLTAVGPDQGQAAGPAAEAS